jgi:hypothetical protein
MCLTGLAAQAMATCGERRGARSEAARQHRRLQSGPCPEEAVAGPGLRGAGDVAPRADVWPGAEGRDARSGEAPSADGPSAEPAFVWAAHPEGTPLGRRDGLLAVGVTGGLAGREGRRGFWWASAGPPCAWS